MNEWKKIFSEQTVSILLIVLLIGYINPFHFWMSDMVQMTLLGLGVACFAFFVMLTWKEVIQDEREQLHRFVAARLASIVVGVVLLLGTFIQSIHHTLDPWLPVALAAMVFAKIVGRWYAQRRY